MRGLPSCNWWSKDICDPEMRRRGRLEIMASPYRYPFTWGKGLPVRTVGSPPEHAAFQSLGCAHAEVGLPTQLDGGFGQGRFDLGGGWSIGAHEPPDLVAVVAGLGGVVNGPLDEHAVRPLLCYRVHVPYPFC